MSFIKYFETAYNPAPNYVRDPPPFVAFVALSPISRNFGTARNAEIIGVSMNFSALNKHFWIAV
jgi:hypothetical protein